MRLFSFVAARATLPPTAGAHDNKPVRFAPQIHAVVIEYVGAGPAAMFGAVIPRREVPHGWMMLRLAHRRTSSSPRLASVARTLREEGLALGIH